LVRRSLHVAIARQRDQAEDEIAEAEERDEREREEPPGRGRSDEKRDSRPPKRDRAETREHAAWRAARRLGVRASARGAPLQHAVRGSLSLRLDAPVGHVPLLSLVGERGGLG